MGKYDDIYVSFHSLLIDDSE